MLQSRYVAAMNEKIWDGIVARVCCHYALLAGMAEVAQGREEEKAGLLRRRIRALRPDADVYTATLPSCAMASAVPLCRSAHAIPTTTERVICCARER